MMRDINIRLGRRTSINNIRRHLLRRLYLPETNGCGAYCRTWRALTAALPAAFMPFRAAFFYTAQSEKKKKRSLQHNVARRTACARLAPPRCLSSGEKRMRNVWHEIKHSIRWAPATATRWRRSFAWDEQYAYTRWRGLTWRNSPYAHFSYWALSANSFRRGRLSRVETLFARHLAIVPYHVSWNSNRAEGRVAVSQPTDSGTCRHFWCSRCYVINGDIGDYACRRQTA